MREVFRHLGASTTHDLVGLSEAQSNELQTFIGGSDKEVSPNPDIERVGYIVARWGDDRVLPILEQRIGEDSNKSLDVVTLVNNEAWSFQVNHQHQTKYNPELDELEWFDFDPRSYFRSGVTFLDWDDSAVSSDVAVITKHELYTARLIYSKIGAYNLRWQYAMALPEAA